MPKRKKGKFNCDYRIRFLCKNMKLDQNNLCENSTIQKKGDECLNFEVRERKCKKGDKYATEKETD